MNPYENSAPLLTSEQRARLQEEMARFYASEPVDNLAGAPLESDHQGKRPDQLAFSASVLVWCGVLLALAVAGGAVGLVIAALSERPL